MVKVSVILPVYNGAHTLSKTLDSLHNQTYKDFELIACIDGSSDASQNILKSYSNKFFRLTILKNEKNRGLGPTMNRLLAHAKGEYVAVAEQDDYYIAERLEIQMKLLNKLPDIGMVSGIAEFMDGEKVTAKFPGILVENFQYPRGKEMFLLNYKQQIKVVNSCMMFKKQVHIDNGLYFTQHYPSISVDWTYVLRFSLVSNIYGINQVLVKIDRSINRNSVTTNKQMQFLASRELIGSMAYEFPNIITKKDFKYAFRTQLLLEWGHNYGIRFFTKGLYYMVKYFKDRRFKEKFVKRINKSYK